MPKQKSKKTELSLSGRGVAIDYAELTESAGKKVIANGISPDRFSELVMDGPREMGPTDLSLYVNGEIVANFDVSKHPTETEKPFELGKKGKYYLVSEDWVKGEWGKLSISGAFDRSKLNVSVSEYDLNGYGFASFDFSYDGKEFEFEWATSKGGDRFMLTPDCEQLRVDFTDDED